MKKTLAIMMSALMVGGLALSGCGGGQTPTTAAPTEARSPGLPFEGEQATPHPAQHQKFKGAQR